MLKSGFVNDKRICVSFFKDNWCGSVSVMCWARRLISALAPVFKPLLESADFQLGPHHGIGFTSEHEPRGVDTALK